MSGEDPLGDALDGVATTDYRALRREILRIDWDETVPAVEAAPAPEAPAAAGAVS